MATYRSVLQNAKKMTRKKDKETSATELLMLHFSSLEPTDLYLKYDEEMPSKAEKEFYQALNLYLEDHKPVQQIIGYVYFYGYRFKVSNEALIPRSETEELVANMLMYYDEYFNGKQVKLVDIGTGSGCLAIALAKEEPALDVFATDISETALSLAKENARDLGASVQFLAGDMLKPLENMKFDILVSNPPYIPNQEYVEEIIYNHEPHIALFGGEDGLVFYKEILAHAKSILNEKSLMGFEHGYDQADRIKEIAMKYFPESKIITLKDMQNKDRMTFVVNGF